MTLMLITVGAFVIVSFIIVAFFYTMTAESPVEQRLRALAPVRAAPAPSAASVERGPSLVRRGLSALGQYSVGGRSESVLSQRLSAAGFRGQNATALFLGTRTLFSFGPALAVLVPQVSSGKPLGRTLGIAAFVWFFGHTLVNAILRRRAAYRIRRITEELPDALDLMIVCLEAGLGLNPTFARVGEERAKMNDPLGRELAQVALELRTGRSREESLRALGARNGVEDLKALAGLIIQSDRLGASMAGTLRAHADLLRTKRRQRAEEAARKLPIKMLLPLAFFILPPLLLVTIGPALLTIGALFKTIAGG
jgi:tight adherence protein C